MTDTTVAAPAEDKKAKKGGGKKKIIIIVAVVLVLAVGYLKFFKGGSSGPEKPVPGAVVTMEPIYLNLSGNHYLKLSLALQGTTKAGKELDGSKALDAAIDVFSNMSVAQLNTPAVRKAAKDKLVDRVVAEYEGEVMDVYLTEFVTQ